MSLVSVRACRLRASGGKSGIVKFWRGIWAPWAFDGSTGSLLAAVGGRGGPWVVIVGVVGSRRLMTMKVRRRTSLYKDRADGGHVGDV